MQKDNKDIDINHKDNLSRKNILASNDLISLIEQGKFIKNVENYDRDRESKISTLFKISWGRSYTVLKAGLRVYVGFLQEMVNHINGGPITLQKVDCQYQLSNIYLIQMLRAYVDKKRGDYSVSMKTKIDFIEVLVNERVVELQILANLEKRTVMNQRMGYAPSYLNDKNFILFLFNNYKFRVYAPTNKENVDHPTEQDIVFYQCLIDVIYDQKVDMAPVCSIDVGSLLNLALDKYNYINDLSYQVVLDSKESDKFISIFLNQDEANEKRNRKEGPRLAP